MKYFVTHDLNVGINADKVLRVLSTLRAVELCPFDWEEGNQLLWTFNRRSIILSFMLYLSIP